MSALEYMQDLERQLSEAQQRSAELVAENERLTANRDELVRMVGLLKGRRLAAELLHAEAGVRERDETMTIAYRLWLQGYHREVGDYLLPFSTDLKREGGGG